MTKYDFTLEDVRREVLALADERPDFVYTAQKEREGKNIGSSCSYTGAVLGSTVGEACIFGQALTRLGVPQEVLMDCSHSIGSLLYDDLDLDDYDIDYAAAFTDVQQAQDYGTPWGKAVEPLRNLKVKAD